MWKKAPKETFLRMPKDRIDFRVFTLALCILVLFPATIFSSQLSYTLKKSKSYKIMSVKVLGSVELPKWYHEGLFFDGKNIWVANGKNGKIWIVDPASGAFAPSIEPISVFTEAVTKISDDLFFVTDWEEGKLYEARIENNKMDVLAWASLKPAHPAGAVWTGDRLFMITWTRGLTGTKFELLDLTRDMKISGRISIKNIQEPTQLAWDGNNLWISSWYDPLVYKVDVKTWEILGVFRSPVNRTTGIAWDGKYMWLTGTYSDLYKLEIVEKEEAFMKLTVTSDAFKEGEVIPSKYTCDGKDISPQLNWAGIPSDAKSIALISDDPDAPMGTWVHWVMYNMPADTKGLPENVPQKETLENGAIQGINDSHQIGYGGPCPPSGVHRYYFKVYALDAKLSLKPKATKKDLENAMKGHILAEGQLMGRYSRSR